MQRVQGLVRSRWARAHAAPQFSSVQWTAARAVRVPACPSFSLGRSGLVLRSPHSPGPQYQALHARSHGAMELTRSWS